MRTSISLVTTLLALALTTMDPARYLPPEGAPYLVEEARINVEGRNSLGGSLTLPSRGASKGGWTRRYGAVLLLAASNRDDRDGAAAPPNGDWSASRARPLYDLADTLGRRDVAVLRLDGRGVGASTGTADSTSVLDRAEDARAGLDYLRRQPNVDPRRIALLGMGDGATVAQFVASGDSLVRALVLMAAPADSTAPRDRGVPVLVVEGGADAVLPGDAGARLSAALRAGGARDVTARMLPGLGHDLLRAAAFSGSAPPPGSAYGLPPEVRGAVADWLAAQLGPPTEVRYVVHVTKPHAHRRRHSRRRR